MTRRWVQSALLGGIVLIMLLVALSAALPSVWMIAYGVFTMVAYEMAFAIMAGRGLRVEREILDAKGRLVQRIVSGDVIRVVVSFHVPWASRWTVIRWRTNAPVDTVSGQVEYRSFFPFWKSEHVFPVVWTDCKRGRYEFGEVVIRVMDWFGLQTVTAVRPLRSILVVHPRRYPLSDWNWLMVTQMSATGHELRGRFESNGFPLGVRPHRIGDRPSQIHWPATARLGHLVSRDDSTKHVQEVVLTLDIDEADYSDRESAVFEWAVSLCASLLEGLSKRGLVVLLCIGPQSFRVPPAAGGQQDPAMLKAMDTLAEIRPTSVPHQSLQDGAVMGNKNKHALWVWVGPRWRSSPELSNFSAWIIPISVGNARNRRMVADSADLPSETISPFIFEAFRWGSDSQAEIVLQNVREVIL